ncbi:putative licABCH operon regulator [Lactiplantibacillus plantarum]|nr:putative licABCH operon regulator [Lactiplantibacillus plantarum]
MVLRKRNGAAKVVMIIAPITAEYRSVDNKWLWRPNCAIISAISPRETIPAPIIRYIDLDRSGLVERTIVDWLRSVLTDYDNQLLRNLTLHLRPALVRIKNGISITNPYCNQVKTYFPVAFDQALALAMAIEKQYHLQLTEDEIAYLALHFESFIDGKLELRFNDRSSASKATGAKKMPNVWSKIKLLD